MATFLNTVIAVLIFSSTVIAADAPPAGNTAALVNGAGITTAEYRDELARVLRLRKKTEQDLDQSTLAMTKKEALETLIGRELLFQQSQREGISIPDAEVDAEISMLRSQFPSEGDFIASLGKRTCPGRLYDPGIRRGMAIKGLTDARFGAKSAVIETEARNYYDSHQEDFKLPVQIRLSHILVKPGTVVNGSGTTPARTKIENIHRRILQGEDFSQLAQNSDDTASSVIGGDLGWFTPGKLEKNLEAAAFALGAGRISPIIEDHFGYHILKVTERRSETVQPFEDVRERISGRLRRERLLSELRPYLKRLREAARIEIHMFGDN